VRGTDSTLGGGGGGAGAGGGGRYTDPTAGSGSAEPRLPRYIEINHRPENLRLVDHQARARCDVQCNQRAQQIAVVPEPEWPSVQKWHERACCRLRYWRSPGSQSLSASLLRNMSLVGFGCDSALHRISKELGDLWPLPPATHQSGSLAPYWRTNDRAMEHRFGAGDAAKSVDLVHPAFDLGAIWVVLKTKLQRLGQRRTSPWPA